MNEICAQGWLLHQNVKHVDKVKVANQPQSNAECFTVELLHYTQRTIVRKPKIKLKKNQVMVLKYDFQTKTKQVCYYPVKPKNQTQ